LFKRALDVAKVTGESARAAEVSDDRLVPEIAVSVGDIMRARAVS